MNQEINNESKDWTVFFESLDQILAAKKENQSGLFGNIEKHFRGHNRKIDEKTLGSYYKDYKDDKGVLPAKSTISEVSVMELNKFLRTAYPDILDNKFNFDEFDYHYIYYYNGSEDYIKPAILCLKKDNGEWGSGVVYYLSKDQFGYKHNSTFILKRLFPAALKGAIQKFLCYQGISEAFPEQVNLFTLSIGERPIDKRFLFFLASISIGNTNHSKIAATNIGVAKKTEKEFMRTEIQSPIDPWITNALIGRRVSFDKIESSVFTTQEKFMSDKKSNSPVKTTNLQYTCCSILKAHYIGVYPRNEIPSSSNKDNGGIAFVLMEFLEDGNATINFRRSSNNELVTYTGVFHFPTDSYKILKGDFEVMKPRVFRFSLFLNKLEDSNKLGGIFSGFKEFTPFASPIIFYRLPDSNNDTAKLIEKYNPGRINKHDIATFFKSAFGDETDNWLKKVKEDLFQISKDFLETPNNCFLTDE